MLPLKTPIRLSLCFTADNQKVETSEDSGLSGFNQPKKLNCLTAHNNSKGIDVVLIGESTTLSGKLHAAPATKGTNSLEGYKVVAEFQAYKVHTLYGKSIYAYVELQLKDQTSGIVN